MSKFLIGFGVLCVVMSMITRVELLLYLGLFCVFRGWIQRKPTESDPYISPKFPKGAYTQNGGYVNFKDGTWHDNYNGTMSNQYGDTVEVDVYGNFYFSDDSEHNNESDSYGNYTMDF